MADSVQVDQVLRFAALLTPLGADAAGNAAHERGWLDPAGRITDTGRQLSRALADQRDTRSIYRVLF